ncbi:hypothetical protein ABZW47_25735 [Streptomyces sp. NPDC004549]|uniref:hypothetical protein n=1 Tax=Streptomyces sp. NPDC004549 TaxID=3154283 RepID=UPI0033A05C47
MKAKVAPSPTVGIASSLAAVLLLAGCAGAEQDRDQSEPKPSSSSGIKTTSSSDATSELPIDADQVLCSDWSTSLSDTQMTQVVTDLLVARRREDGIDAEPKQALISRMNTEVMDACGKMPTTLVRAIVRFRYTASKGLYGFH